MKNPLLLLGSNVGDRENNLSIACNKIETHPLVILQKSRIYQTAPWKMDSNQREFFNQAVEISTVLTDPFKLLEILEEIENEMGRSGKGRNQKRIIDIDILFWGNKTLQTERLTLPHPLLSFRNFALIPAYEILPEWRHPVRGISLGELMVRSPDNLPVFITNAT